MKHTLYSHYIHAVQPYLCVGIILESQLKKVLTSLHCTAVASSVCNRGPNAVLGRWAPPISEKEKYLPGRICDAFSQLRSGKCIRLTFTELANPMTTHALSVKRHLTWLPTFSPVLAIPQIFPLTTCGITLERRPLSSPVPRPVPTSPLWIRSLSLFLQNLTSVFSSNGLIPRLKQQQQPWHGFDQPSFHCITAGNWPLFSRGHALQNPKPAWTLIQASVYLI
jgi:hypothetical protein